MSHFGEHLTLDGYGGDKERLNDKELVYNFLTELVVKLNMHILSGPDVVFAPGNDGKDPGGWSGFVIIEESHISIHTFPGRGFLSADVYTCQEGMDTRLVEEAFKETFKLADIETNFIKRGKKYPEANIYQS